MTRFIGEAISIAATHLREGHPGTAAIEAAYDGIAGEYDALHSEPGDLGEDEWIKADLGPLLVPGLPMAELGSGTGMLLDLLDIPPDEYMGLELSRGMIAEARRKHPNRQDTHDFMLLVKSMMEDGFTQPIIVLRDGRRIVDGEHRWTGAIVTAAVQKQGIKPGDLTEDIVDDLRHRRAALLDEMPDLQIPVVEVDMSPEQARISTLRHNRARGSEDIDLTAALLRDLEKLGAIEWAQDSLMLDDTELDRLLNDVPAPEALAGDEYGEAWTPGARTEKDGSRGESESYSLAAMDARRQAEEDAKTAQTDDDRARILRERDNYRFGFSFTGDEATIVRSVLGDQPAAMLLTICTALANVGEYRKES